MLRSCPNCSKAISYRARACPHCGEPWPFTGINPILLPIRRFLKEFWIHIKIVGYLFLMLAAIGIPFEIIENTPEPTLLKWYAFFWYLFISVLLAAGATMLFFAIPIYIFLKFFREIDDDNYKRFIYQWGGWYLLPFACLFCYGYFFDGFLGLLN